MARGKAVADGATRVSQNGYHYTKTGGKWRLTHHIVAEQILGRPLREDERVSFKDPKQRLNLEPSNIVISEKGQGSIRRRKAQLEVRIAELQAELDEINKELLAGRGFANRD
jgi:hypothetical protein